MRSKTLTRYQQGYCGQPANIEAMKPREARAYCLGVGHVAAGTLPLGSGTEVLAALSARRRGVGGMVKVGEKVIIHPDPVDILTQNALFTARVAPNTRYSVEAVDKDAAMIAGYWVHTRDLLKVR